jgi:hypothetical protein
MKRRLTTAWRRLAEQRVPRGAVLVLCGAIVLPPAGMALSHSLEYNGYSKWIHHHTRAYTICNGFTTTGQEGFFDPGELSIADWDTKMRQGSPAVTFTEQATCHPTSGTPADLQLQDVSYGDVGWRASDFDDSDSTANAGFHSTHTHLKFNIAQIPNGYGSSNRRALVCRQIGLAVGIDRVRDDQWTAEKNAVGGNGNDCMSFGGDPSAQTAKWENASNYTYDKLPGDHTQQKLTAQYAADGPSVPPFTGSLWTASQQSTTLTQPSYDLHVAATGGPDVFSGIRSIEIKVDGAVQGQTPVWTCTSVPCSRTRDWTFTTTAFAPGQHTVEVNVTDQGEPGHAGLSTSRSFAVTVGMPDTTISYRPPSQTTSTTAPFSLSSPQGAQTFDCRLDSGAWADCGTSKSYTGLAEGHHVFDARAKFAGAVDATPATADWIVDHEAPEMWASDAVDVGDTLTINAADGDPATPEDWRSGVKSIDLTINGSVVASTGNQSCTATARSCTLQLSHVLTASDLDAANPTISALSTDQLGQSATLQVVGDSEQIPDEDDNGVEDPSDSLDDVMTIDDHSKRGVVYCSTRTRAKYHGDLIFVEARAKVRKCTRNGAPYSGVLADVTVVLQHEQFNPHRWEYVDSNHADGFVPVRTLIFDDCTFGGNYRARGHYKVTAPNAPPAAETYYSRNEICY